MRLGMGLQMRKRVQSAPIIPGKMFSSLPDNENYVDTGIAPVDSENWYWEVYAKMPQTDDTNSYPGAHDNINYTSLDFSTSEGSWYIDYKSGGGASVSSCNTDFHIFKFYGNGKFYVDGTLAIDASAASGVIPNASINIFNIPGYYGYSDWVYSKIVNNGTVLQHIDFCTAGDGFVFDRVTGDKFTINGTIGASSWSDQTEYNNLQDGYDIWKKDADDSLIYIPYDLNGDPILTSGGTLTGYTWVSTNP